LFQVKPGGITYLRLESPFGHVHFRLQEAGIDVGAKETAVLLAIKDKDSFTTTLSSKAPEQASR
jgi:hypothetical protein